MNRNEEINGIYWDIFDFMFIYNKCSTSHFAEGEG